MGFVLYIQGRRMDEEICTNDMLIIPPIFNGFAVKGFFTTKAVNGNLKAISKLARIPVSNVYQPIQKHTDRIIVLNSNREKEIADAVITTQSDILIGIDVADCVPILLYDKNKEVIGAVHAGWRGTAKEILKKTIDKMFEKFNSSAKDILIAIGPAIRHCCYEVGSEVMEAVRDVTGEGAYYIQKKDNDKYYLDLPTANIYQAISLGVPKENIWILPECTYCLPDRFNSYRYTKGKTDKQSGFIMIIK